MIVLVNYFDEAPSPIHDHCNTTGHDMSIEKFSIMGREDQNIVRSIKEAIQIRVNDPSLTRIIGKYQPATYMG